MADGRYESVSQAANQIVKIKDTVSPEKDLVEKYERGYEKYRELYPALKNFMGHM